MRINLHVIVIGAGLTGSFFLKEMIAYLHMKQENLIRTDITVFDPGQSVKRTLARYISGKILARTGHFYYQNF